MHLNYSKQEQLITTKIILSEARQRLAGELDAAEPSWKQQPRPGEAP
jgi:hypothetical protein